VYDYLAAHRKVVVEPFPPYAPELNPVDYVWSYVKYDRLPNFCTSGLSGLRTRITAEFQRLQKRSASLHNSKHSRKTMKEYPYGEWLSSSSTFRPSGQAWTFRFTAEDMNRRDSENRISEAPWAI
jgi:hypothetical protein